MVILKLDFFWNCEVLFIFINVLGVMYKLQIVILGMKSIEDKVISYLKNLVYGGYLQLL